MLIAIAYADATDLIRQLMMPIDDAEPLRHYAAFC